MTNLEFKKSKLKRYQKALEDIYGGPGSGRHSEGSINRDEAIRKIGEKGKMPSDKEINDSADKLKMTPEKVREAIDTSIKAHHKIS